MRPLYVELSEDDWRLLCGIASAAGVSKVKVIRWAIRLFGICGGWTDDYHIRAETVGAAPLETGPERRKV